MGTSTSRVKLQGEETVSTAAERASRSIRQMKSEIERGTGPIREMGKLANSLFALGGATAAIAVFRRVSAVVQDCISEYQKHEQAVAQLTAAFRSGNSDISMTVDSLVGLAEQLQRTTLFSHDASESAMGLMRTIGGLGSSQIKTMLPLLQDFATRIGVDIEQAAKMASQSIEGTRNTLGRFGIELDKNMTVSEKVAAIVDQLREKFGGLARAVADTATGSIIKLRNAMADLKEEGGRAMANFFKPLVDWYRKIVEGATDALKAHNDLVEALKHREKGAETAKDTIVLYTNKIKELQAEIKNFRLAGGYGVWEKELKDIQAQISAYGRAIDALKQKAAADREAAEAADAAHQAELTMLERLEDAYGKTSEGQFAALRTLIAYWETAQTKYKEHAAEIRAILLPLYEELRKATAGAAPAKVSWPNLYGMEQRAVTAPPAPATAINWGNLYDMEQRALEGVARASINVANQFGLLERSTTDVVEVTKELAVERYKESLGAWAKPAEMFAGTEVGGAIFGEQLGMETGALAGMFGSLGGAIGAILPIIMTLAATSEVLNAVLNPVATILKAMFDVIKPLMDSALKPLVGILVLIGQYLGKVLAPIFEILAPIIKIVAQAFVFLYNFSILPLANAIITVFNIIYDIVATVWNAIAAAINFLLGWLGVHVNYMQYRGLTQGWLKPISYADIEAAGETVAKEETGGGMGSSTTVQRAPDIYIYITVQGSVYGPGGLRQVGGEMAQALEEFAGIGGRIHIEEAIAPVRG